MARMMPPDDAYRERKHVPLNMDQLQDALDLEEASTREPYSRDDIAFAPSSSPSSPSPSLPPLPKKKSAELPSIFQGVTRIAKEQLKQPQPEKLSQPGKLSQQETLQNELPSEAASVIETFPEEQAELPELPIESPKPFPSMVTHSVASQANPSLLEEDEQTMPEDMPVRPKTKRQIAMAQKRQQNYFKRRRDQKRVRVLYGRLRWMARLAFACFLAYGLYLFATASFWQIQSAQFRLTGARLTTPPMFTAALSGTTGQLIYQVDPQTLARKIKQVNPIVDRVYIRRLLFPSRLQVNVVEKTPWAVLFDSEASPMPYGVLSYDSVGHYDLIPIESLQVRQLEALRALTRRPLTKVIYPMLNCAHLAKQPYAKRLDRLTYQLQSIPSLHLMTLNLSNPSLLLAYFSEGVQVRLGRMNQDFDERIARLGPLVPTLQKMKDRVDWVDLRWSRQVALHKKDPHALTKPKEVQQPVESPLVNQPEPQPTVQTVIPKPSQDLTPQKPSAQKSLLPKNAKLEALPPALREGVLPTQEPVSVNRRESSAQ